MSTAEELGLAAAAVGIAIAFLPAIGAVHRAARAIVRNARKPAEQIAEPPPEHSAAEHYRAAIAAATNYAEAAEPGTVRDAVWDRAFLQMLTAQGLAISTRQATGDAYPYGFAMPAEYLGKFYPPGFTPWIVWQRDA